MKGERKHPEPMLLLRAPGLTVTQAVKSAVQPREGYLPLEFMVRKEYGHPVLGPENVRADYVGMAVDYLSRYIIDKDVNHAFEFSLRGMYNCARAYSGELAEYGLGQLDRIKGLDRTSVTAALRAVQFDIFYRRLPASIRDAGIGDIEPDENTVSNIVRMVDNTLSFLESAGGVADYGVNFDLSSFYGRISRADCDYVTHNAIWEMKTSKYEPKPTDTLQVAVYQLLGAHSDLPIFEGVNYFGIYNPRLDISWGVRSSALPYTMELISKEVILDEPPSTEGKR